VDLLNRTVEVLAITVTNTNERLVEHIGWHSGYEDSQKLFKDKKK
jgi:hypothetical protein